MIANKQVSDLLIAFSLGVSIVLIMLPLPEWATGLRPVFYVLTVLFWALMQPLRFGIGMAWCCGLLADVLYGTPLGQHGLALAIAAYLVIKLRELLWIFAYWQQAIWVLAILLVYEFVLFWIDGILGYDVATFRRWFPAVTSAIIWPIWALSLERIAEMDVRY